YFGMTKFGMKKTETYVPSDSFVELKGGTYVVQKNFIGFFNIEGDPSTMTIDALYDGFIACLKSSI
ncbi:MAG: hypothetical protein ACKOAK_02560, partial [Ignavibacteria bacterium]